jgi:hypothetical protein
LLPPLLALPLIGGCAGYAADYWSPKQKLIAEQLPRYGLDTAQSRCVTERLTKALSVWQLRQLGDRSGRLVRTRGTAAPQDLRYVAGLVRDPKVAPEVSKALEGCGAAGAVASSTVAAAPAPADPAGLVPGGPAPVGGAPGSAPAPLRWIDLGKAETGQGIALDITSLATVGARREAWFRLSNPGEAASAPTLAYRLRIDCTARTITPTGARKYKPDGTLDQQEDYSGEWQSPLPVEAGTVMEIAFNRVCG